MKEFSRRLRQVASPFFWLGRLYSFRNRFRFGGCGAGFHSGYPLTVTGGRNITIGNKFSAMGTDYLYADEGQLVIGDNCSLNTNVLLGASGGKIVIGDNVLIGPNVVLRASNHGLKRDALMRFQPHTYGEIIIEDDVWIGANAVITADVRLAKGTVVGAGAVVTRSTEVYSIVGGVPARRIGERV